jgi:hypothetical protein
MREMKMRKLKALIMEENNRKKLEMEMGVGEIMEIAVIIIAIDNRNLGLWI